MSSRSPYRTPGVVTPAYPNGVTLTGSSGSYIWCPDTAALSFSTDLELVMRLRATDWTAAGNQIFVAKYDTTGAQRSWRIYHSTTNTVGVTTSADGTAVATTTLTPTAAFTNDVWAWMRIRLDLTNGSNCVITLDVAADTGSSSELPGAWTANGTNTGTIVTGLFDSSARLEIGGHSQGTSERFAGRVGRVILKSGFDGTTVADFNSELSAPRGYADAYGNLWTIP